MNSILKTTIAILLVLNNNIIAQQSFQPTAESLTKYEVPEWYEDSKIGYWVHWGLYSVPAFGGEWYGRWMYVNDTENGKETSGFRPKGAAIANHHRSTYGNPSEFGYKDFIPMWKAEKFNADTWADLFVEGGAKFFTMMGMHHDNYPLWNSETTPINSFTTGPKRDFVGEMEKAVRKHGLKFGVSNHSAWNSAFFHFNHVNKFDANTSPMYGMAHPDADDVAKWWARSTELSTKYRPDLVWFDWGWNKEPYTEQTRMNFCSWYYNRANEWGMSSSESPEVVVAYKFRGMLPDGSAVLDVERGGMNNIYPYVWMNDTSLGLKWWCYADNEKYRSSNQVIDMLLDIISKNGILQLNIGPKADGTIPSEVQDIIREIGQWLKVNGEAVYATRPWQVYGEGPTQPTQKLHGDQVEYTAQDIRFTRSKNNDMLYISALGYNSKYLITTLNSNDIDLSTIESVELISSGKKLKYKQSKKGLTIFMPSKGEENNAAYAFRVNFNDNKIPQLNK